MQRQPQSPARPSRTTDTALRPRVAYLGPPGTFTEEALRASAPADVEEVPCATVRDAVMAVQSGETDRAVVPIENALEGSVRATLDALVADAPDVEIEAQVTHPIHHCLLARSGVRLEDLERVISHPHALSQCRRFVSEHLPGVELGAAPSTADAVRLVAEADGAWGALGSRLSAELYGCNVLADGVADRADNLTRFVWLAPAADAGAPVARLLGDGSSVTTSIVFWGFDDESPGALVGVLSELADRGVNLTKIESRPRRVRLGHYMFFADLDGSTSEPAVAAALEGLADRVETLRVLGSYPAADATGAAT
jgi:prephenate dehydratase